MTFTDTHTHLYDEQLVTDAAQVTRALAAGVSRMYMPNCNSETIAGMLQVADQWPGNCMPMMGLHPCYVKENYQEELAIVEAWLDKRTFYAVGEIGLDYYWDLTWKQEQMIAFETQVSWAISKNLPVVIHSRESLRDCIDVIKRWKGQVQGIFHCFSGTIEDAMEITEMGMYLGIGGVVTYKKSTLPEVVQAISLDHLVLETDAPYLAPAPYRGKRNESSYIPIIAEKIAILKGCSIADVAATTTANARKVFPEQATPAFPWSRTS